MEIRILGPVEVWQSGQRYDPGPDKLRCLLSILALNLKTVVPDDVLIERLWDADPPAKARENLQVYATRLRGVLRQAAGGDAGRLERRAHGYMLGGDPDDVDIYRFRGLCRRAAALRATGEPAEAAALLREADGLWQGQALAGLAGDAIARVRHGLEEERRAAILERLNLESALGRYAGMVAELTQLLDRYPMDEAFIAHQIDALDRSGRPADALSAYRAARIRLVRELGAEPGPVLVELHQRILRRGAVGRPERSSEKEPPAFAPDTLPAGPREFAGRAEEIETLTAPSSEAIAIWVVTGIPGIGKTALIVQAARELRGRYMAGVLYFSFRTHDPEHPPLGSAEALRGLLGALAMPPERIPADPVQCAAAWQVELTRLRLIVVLDDVAGLDQLRPLLPAAGSSRFFIASRRRISGVSRARNLSLGALSVDDATELFVRVAGQSRAGNPAEVAEAVRLCGGLPLALRDVARGLRRDDAKPLADVLEELSQSPASLSGTVLPSAGVMTAFGRSYAALDGTRQRLFRRLGLHPGAGITAHAAAALDGAPLAVTEAAMAGLADHQLLERSDDHFRFPGLMHRFAGICAARDETEPDCRAAFGRLLDFYQAGADQADRLLYPHARRAPAEDGVAEVPGKLVDNAQQAAEWMTLEWRNVLHAARRAGEHERKKQCIQLTMSLTGFLEASGHWNEAAEAYALMLQACRDVGDVSGAARASLELSIVNGRTGQHDAALRHAEEAAAIYRSILDRQGWGDALDHIGVLHRNSGRFHEALAHHRAAEELYRETGDQRGEANTLSHIGIAFYHLGRYPGAVEHFHRALEIYRAVDDRRSVAKMLNNIGKMQLHQGFYQDALQNNEEALQIFSIIGGEQNQAILHHNIGCIQRSLQNYDQALGAYRRALAIYRRIGDQLGVLAVLNDTGVTYQALSNFADAFTNHRRASELAEELGDSYGRVIALRGIADAHRAQGRHEEAVNCYQGALHLAREIGERYQEGKVLEGLADTIEQTQGAAAARIWRHQALDALEPLGVPDADVIRLRLGPAGSAGGGRPR